MKAESRQIPQKLAARLKFVYRLFVLFLFISWVIWNNKQLFLNVGGITPWGRFWGTRGRTKQRGDKGVKQHNGDENAQPYGFYRFPHLIYSSWKRIFGCHLNALKAKKPLVDSYKRDDVRLYLTKMSPNIPKLCEGRQAHPSYWTGDHGMYLFL